MSNPDLSPLDRQSEACQSCGKELPLLSESPDEDKRHWLCGGCGEPLYAALRADYELEHLRNVRPSPISFDRDALPYPAAEVLEYARSLVQLDLKGTEKRNAFRHSVTMPVPAQPLDEMLLTDGEAFSSASRNLSTNGICLLHTRPVTNKFLGLELSIPRGGLIQVLMHVRRNRQRGPYHDVAGEFITKMAPSDETA